MYSNSLSRNAITSYLRGSSLSSEPSPSQPPLAMPANETVLPSGETLLIFSNPSLTPIQCVTASPLRQTSEPAAVRRLNTSASTRASCSTLKALAQMVLASMSLIEVVVIYDALQYQKFSYFWQLSAR